MSIIFQHLVRNDDGALPIDQNTPPPQPQNSQGLIINADGWVYGKLIGELPIVRYYYGLPFNAEGGLVFTGETIAYYDQGIPFAANGAIAATAVPVDDEFYNQGMKYSIGGRFLVATVVVPMNPPDPVTNVVVTEPNVNALHVTWDTPPSPDAPINGYAVEYKLSTDTLWTLIEVGVVNSTDINGLTAGLIYDVRVAANNLYGLGPFSAVAQGQPEALPAAPTNVQLTAGVTQITATWNAVVAYPTVTAYTIEWAKTSDLIWTALNVGLNLSHVITGLQAGITYSVRVRATNARGNGPYSTIANAVVLGLPQQPTGLTATAGVDTVTLNWTAPASDPPLTRYDIQLKEAANTIWFSFKQLTFTNSQIIANLAGGTLYNFRVRGVNANGFGPWSLTANSTPTAVVAPAVVVLNNLGISMPPAAVGVTNVGTGGATRNFTRQDGAGAALTYTVQNNRTGWQSAGNRMLSATTQAQALLAQPQTLFWAGIPTTVDGSFRTIWSTNGEAAGSQASTSGTTLVAGGSFASGVALNTTHPYVIVFTLNGANSFIRIIQSISGVDSVTGPFNCGSNGVALNALFWTWNTVFGTPFIGKCFEFREYNGSLNAAEELGVLRSLTSKWFTDRSTIGPPVADVKYNEEGVVSTGVGTTVTAWKNTGALFDVNNYTQTAGAGTVTHITRNGLKALSTAGNVRLFSPTAATPINTPYTLYVACRPTTVDANSRYIFKGTNVTLRVTNTQFSAFAGSTLTGTNGGGAVVLALIVNGASSRFLGQGPSTLFDTTGNAGTNAYVSDGVFWDALNTANLSYIGEIFEVQVHTAAHTNPLISSVINTLRTKWSI